MDIFRWLFALVILYLLYLFVRSIGKVLAGIVAAFGAISIFLPLNGQGPPEVALIGLAFIIVAILAWINDDGITKDVSQSED
jgi:hypothetical protein